MLTKAQVSINLKFSNFNLKSEILQQQAALRPLWLDYL
jgi:hypothetical protein